MSSATTAKTQKPQGGLLSGLFSFRGRIGRAAFLGLVGAAYLIGYPLRLLLDVALIGTTGRGGMLNAHIPTALRGIVLPQALAAPVEAACLAGIAILVLVGLSSLGRRFHDMGLTGWTSLPVLAGLLFVPDVDVWGVPLPPLATLSILAAVAAIPGSRGANKFGV